MIDKLLQQKMPVHKQPKHQSPSCEPRRVSVFLIVNDGQALKPRAIEGVLMQQHTPLELFILDDHSSQSSMELVSSYMKNDHRIRYLPHDSPQGHAAAINTALRYTRGPYVAFLNPHDAWVDPDKLAMQVAAFENAAPNVALVATSTIQVDTNGTCTPQLAQPGHDLARQLLVGKNPIHHSTVLTRRDVLETLGGFDEHIRLFPHHDFYRNCIIRHRYQVIFLPEITTSCYSVNAESPCCHKSPTRHSPHRRLEEHWYTLQKYSGYMAKHPTCLATQIARIAQQWLRTRTPRLTTAH